ncbi:MAG: hypothetical protein JNN32_07110 [Flavobacteriales bacterium]|nr:hypothetical protein [Flavobacteriales bacterium]
MLATTGNNAIVDWVFLELRGAAPTYTVLATRCALLQRDGDIVDVNGTSPVSFAIATGNYHVVVRHRNHLGVMSANTVAIGPTGGSIDFTNTSTATYGTDAQRTVGSVRTMWTGDCSSDGEILYSGGGNDRDLILVRIGGSVPTNSVSGYLREDVNLDGAVLYTGGGNDRDLILQAIGGVVPTNNRTEQLP